MVGTGDPADRTGDSCSTGCAGEVLRGGSQLAALEVLGRSLLEAAVENLRMAGIGPISLLTPGSLANQDSGLRDSPGSAVESIRVEEDVVDSIGLKLKDHAKSGIDTTVVIRLGAYIEIDLTEAVQFHREQGQPATRLTDADGPLDIWIADTSHFAAGADVLSSLQSAGQNCYAAPGYINRLAHPRDLRHLAVDALTGRCRLRPRGSEVQPGIWVGEGAQVHRGARVVAPAFIGRTSIIGEDCVIADCSVVENDCEIDYGSTLSDVSLLPNSYVGIGLDLRHSVVSGGTLLSLEHDMTLEISDPGVVRFNKAPHKDVGRQSPAAVEVPGMLFTPAEEAAN